MVYSVFRQFWLLELRTQISTDIWFFVAFNILVIRVHPCPQNGNSDSLFLKGG